MSASTIARWNAIPLERPNAKDDDGGDDSDDNGGFEKPQYLRDLEGEESDDNVSIVSRTPSPKPVDPMDIGTFDEHLPGRYERQVVTVNTRISSTNKGFALLAKMGWKEGTGLGLSEDARVDPIPFVLKADSTGIGKAAMDARVIEATVSQRRDLDSEKQMKESEEQRKKRESNVVQKQNIKSELAQTLRPFYCELCDKQYSNVAQFDEHCNSYAHAHKQRFKDLQTAERMKKAQAGEVDARKEKERKREEKELRKIAKAAGIKMPATSANTPLPVAPLAPTTESSDKPSGFKKSGWATVSGNNEPGPSGGGFKKAGWSAVAPPASSPAVEIAPESAPSGFKKSGWAAVGAPAAAPLEAEVASSGFKRAGWANVGDASSATITPAPASLPATSAPIAPSALPAAQRAPTGFKKIGFSSAIAAPAAAPNAASPATAADTRTELAPVPEPAVAPQPQAKPAPRKNAEVKRANWASFQRGVPVQPPPAPAPAPTASVPQRQPLPTGTKRKLSRSRSRSGSRSRSRSPPRRRRSYSRSRSRSRSRSPPRRHRLPGSRAYDDRGPERGRDDRWNDDRERGRDDRWDDRGRRGRDDARYGSSGYGRR